MISVIIPVFNGGAFLRRTLDSLQAQQFSDFEVLCVDDGSSDDSLAILAEYASRDSRIRVLQTPRNFGIVPSVINFASARMRGQYFVYSSQDDFYSSDWLSEMYKVACCTGADAVLPNLVFWYGEGHSSNRRLSGLESTGQVEISGHEAVALSIDWDIHTNALWNIQLLRDQPYFEFSVNADEHTARAYFLLAEKVCFSSGTFYYSQTNLDAITKKFSTKMLGIPVTDLWLCRLMVNHNFKPELISKVYCRSVESIFWFVERSLVDMVDKEVLRQKIEKYLAALKDTSADKFPMIGWPLKARLKRWALYSQMTFHGMVSLQCA